MSLSKKAVISFFSLSQPGICTSDSYVGSDGYSGYTSTSAYNAWSAQQQHLYRILDTVGVLNNLRILVGLACKRDT